MKYYIILFFIVLFISCGQEKNQTSQTENYLENPNEKDTLCIKELDRAKKDADKGRIAFCSSMGMVDNGLRYQKELEQLCKQYNLIFAYEMFSDVIVDGQTQGCYGVYMDKIIENKFGKNFKIKLAEQADSIFIVNAINDTIEYWECDVRPHLPNQKSEYDVIFEIPTSHELKSKLIPEKNGHYPFMDIGFIIEVNGQTSGHFCGYFNNSGNPSNEKYIEQMWIEAMKEFEKHPIWEPGQIKGHKVRTRNNVRVYF